MKQILFSLLFLFAIFVVEAQSSRTLSLNGKWQVAVANTQPDVYPAWAPVPGVISQAKPSLGVDFDATKLKGDVGYEWVWYATDFDLSTSHDGYDNANYTHALLCIRAKYNALVILNGVEIGYDAHSTYSHAEFDVSHALNFQGANHLVVRVGSWNTASFPSKENSSEWWRGSRAPGVCDEVTLQLTHEVVIRHLKLLPNLTDSMVICTAQVANQSHQTRRMRAKALISDCRHDIENDFDEIPFVSQTDLGQLSIPGDSTTEFTFRIPTPMLRPWTPGREGDPQLYEFNFTLIDEVSMDCRAQVFGFRDIRVEGRDLFINGQKCYFRAENVAFQRALNRWAEVLFDETWIRRFLRSAVEEYGFNYLRVHLGHAYNKWYDIADEVGLMIQDEWAFMHEEEPVGDSLAQTERELRRWVRENVNHPSIVAWDQENEGNVKLEALKSELRRYDPTRLFGEDDYDARHIYAYSETITDTPIHPLNDSKPLTVFESCRLWLNEEGELERRENFKTSRTVSGWGLYFYTPAEVAQLQADIHADLGTFYRSRRVQGWAPFALLSGAVNGHNFFKGNICDSLVPQANLQVLARLNEPLGVSIEMNQAREWYKDKIRYKPAGKCSKMVWAWNDTGSAQRVTVEVALSDLSNRELTRRRAVVSIPSGGATAIAVALDIPRKKGVYLLRPRIVMADGRRIEGVDRRIMVARGSDAEVEGVMAFGGHDKPFDGCRSILANFLDGAIPLDVQCRIVAALGGDLIDSVEPGKEGGFRLQSTRYLEPTRMLSTTRVFDSSGRQLAATERESMTFVSLEKPIREVIVAVVGAVPVDESKITLRRQEGVDVYTITMIGSDLRHTIRMTPSGKLLDAKAEVRKR